MDVQQAVPQYTSWLLFSLCMLVVLWDMVADYKWGETATVSWWILTTSQQVPLLAFAVGILMGHLLWPQRR